MRFIVAVCLLSVAAPAFGAPPVVTFEPQAVTASGVTPRGRVVWFSVGREISNRASRVVPRIQQAIDDDGDGKVRLDLKQDVPLRSIWFAADLETGEAGVAAPGDFPLLEAELPARALPAALNRLDLERQFVYLVLVRPGAGAWTLRVGDGGSSDDDGQPDGTLRAALASLEGIGPSPAPPPERFSPKDLLLVIDPSRMEFLRLQVGN